MYMMTSPYLLLLLITTLSTEGQFQSLDITSHSETLYPHEQEICSNGTCFTIDEETVNKYYKGLFHTPDEIQRLLVEWTTKRREEFRLSALYSPIMSICKVFKRNKMCKLLRNRNQDYDLCCPTKIDNFDLDWMHNIAGEYKKIVHLTNPERRQMIPAASCVSTGACFEGFGVCQVEKISMWLLVFDLSCYPPFKFDQFSIPAYCSCKSR